jgi:DNA repair exonuclease SbcCD nuclease subunit
MKKINIDRDKVIFLGDTHFGCRSGSMSLHNRFELFYDNLFEYMKTNNIDTIIQFGDIFDQRRGIGYAILQKIKKIFFDKLREHKFNLYILLGNHDVTFKNTLTVNSPSLLLNEYANITIMDEPTNLKIGNSEFTVIPWICEENEIDCLTAIDKSKAKYCLGHFELQGFEMHKGIVCEHGTPKELFWKFDHVYSGHFHHISSKDNVTYLGTPYQLTWADYGDERGFYIFDTDKGTTEFIENPFKNFHKINYNDKDNAYTEEMLDKADFSVYNQTYVKVIVTNKSNLYLYDKFIEKLEAAGAIAHAVEDHFNKNVVISDDDTDQTEDINEFFKIVADRYSEQLNPKTLNAYMLSLYNEAINMVSV